MRLLFVHQNFPGQYRHLVRYFSTLPDCEIACIGESGNITRWPGILGVRLHSYGAPQVSNDRTHPYVKGLEDHVRRGQAAARTALEIKKSGFEPDIICVHTGWGEGLYLRDIFPKAKILSYCEFFYNIEGSDANFENKNLISIDRRLLTRTRNATQLISLTGSDWGISPTEWQRAQYPNFIKNNISVIHDGVNTEMILPDAKARAKIGVKSVKMTAGDEIITFVSRNLEPYRGFHIFARALPLIQKIRPKAHIVIVGGSGVSYGAPPPSGKTYREIFMEPISKIVDMSRIHFLGRVPYSHLVKLYQLSAVHVYLTYPFVLSWSMLEAMSAGCLVVGSRTPPVEEVITHGLNGLLVNFFSSEEITDAINSVLEHPTRMQSLRESARNTIVQKYDLNSVCIPKQAKLIKNLIDGNNAHA